MIAISIVASAFLLISVLITGYNTAKKERPSPWIEGIERGTLVVSLLLFTVHHLFISGIMWMAVASLVISLLLIYQFFE